MEREVLVKEFKSLLEENKKNIQRIVEVAEKAHLTNEQYFIDWEDYLNQISTKDHNK